MADATVVHGGLPHAHSSNGGTHSYLENTGKHKGILAWILSTDHKRIGILYLISIFTFFAVGVVLGFLMRLEMLRERANPLAQDCNLYFRRPGIGLVALIAGKNLPLCFNCQCHSKGDTPCLLLISF